MKRPKVRRLSLDALVQLREQVDSQISRLAARMRAELEDKLARLQRATGKATSGATGRRSSMKGRKVPPKYRNPKNRSETWAGRGAMPRWLRSLVEQGRKVEEFAIAKGTSGRPVKRRKKRKMKR
jgi:DNA-binding protein H-NS